MNKQKLLQALEMLDGAASAAMTNRQTHQAIQEAVFALRDFIEQFALQPSTPKKETHDD